MEEGVDIEPAISEVKALVVELSKQESADITYGERVIDEGTAKRLFDRYTDLIDPELSPADEKQRTWQTRILIAPGAISAAALASFAGSRLLAIDLAAALSSISLLLCASIAGAAVPVLRYRIANKDLAYRQALKRWKPLYEMLLKSTISLKQNLGWLTEINIERYLLTIDQYKPKGRIVANKFSTQAELFSALQEMKDDLQTRVLSSSKICTDERDAMEEIKRISKVQTANSCAEITLFWTSVLLFLFAVINPVYVLSFGPIWEWSPAALQLSRASGK